MIQINKAMKSAVKSSGLIVPVRILVQSLLKAKGENHLNGSIKAINASERKVIKPNTPAVD